MLRPVAAASIPRGKTVFVLGAGASLAEAIGHHPVRDREHPPLDRNFFARAARRNRARSPQTPEAALHASLLGRVATRAQGLGVPDLVGQTPAVSLEEYMGRLFYDMNTTASSQNIQAYYDLVRLYNSELLATTNWMIGRNGVIRRAIQRELRDADVSIVTFNHDLLAENALATLSTRHTGAWCLTHAYGLSNLSATISDQSDAYSVDCPGNRDSHIPIFKLHGSCNWVYRTRNPYPSPHVARGDRALFLWTNKQLSQSTQMRIRASGGRTSWYMWPNIIPPVYEKHTYITGDLKRVWDRAGEAIAAATRVVFWGYSFPRADLHARYFFTALSQRNDALKSPTLINPDPRAQDELWAVLQPRRVLHYRDVTAFLDGA